MKTYSYTQQTDKKVTEEVTIHFHRGTRDLWIELVESLDLFTADPLVVRFNKLDDFGEVEIVTVEDEATGEVFWDGNDGGDWTEADSYVVECLEQFFFDRVE